MDKSLEALKRDKSIKNKTVCIIGLGYVGLLLAEAFSKHLKTIGFDIDDDKRGDLNKNFFAKQKPLLKNTFLYKRNLC